MSLHVLLQGTKILPQIVISYPSQSYLSGTQGFWSWSFWFEVWTSMTTNQLPSQVWLPAICLLSNSRRDCSWQTYSSLSAAHLIDHPKSNGDSPIAIGEVLRQIAASATVSSFEDFFCFIFLSNSTWSVADGGSELLIHHVQLALESHLERSLRPTLSTLWIVIKCWIQ